MEKIIARAPELIARAMEGDAYVMALLAIAGISIIGKAIKENS